MGVDHLKIVTKLTLRNADSSAPGHDPRLNVELSKSNYPDLSLEILNCQIKIRYAVLSPLNLI